MTFAVTVSAGAVNSLEVERAATAICESVALRETLAESCRDAETDDEAVNVTE